MTKNSKEIMQRLEYVQANLYQLFDVLVCHENDLQTIFELTNNKQAKKEEKACLN